MRTTWTCGRPHYVPQRQATSTSSAGNADCEGGLWCYSAADKTKTISSIGQGAGGPDACAAHPRRPGQPNQQQRHLRHLPGAQLLSLHQMSCILLSRWSSSPTTQKTCSTPTVPVSRETSTCSGELWSPTVPCKYPQKMGPSMNFFNTRFGYIWCSFDLQEFSTRYSQVGFEN